MYMIYRYTFNNFFTAKKTTPSFFPSTTFSKASFFRGKKFFNTPRQPYIVAAVALKEAGYDVLVLGPTDSLDMAKHLGELTLARPELAQKKMLGVLPCWIVGLFLPCVSIIGRRRGTVQLPFAHLWRSISILFYVKVPSSSDTCPR